MSKYRETKSGFKTFYDRIFAFKVDRRGNKQVFEMVIKAVLFRTAFPII
ncbi:MAG: hypothetical protein JWP78_1261 [Mucilaginibacter sp.]|nr:hypothetical protein [Mucilaginibacter sp.]